MGSEPTADLSADARRHDVFAALWAFAGVLHHASYAGWRWDHPLGWTCLALAAAVIARPGSLALFAAYVAVDLAGLWREMPVNVNHLFLTALLDVSLLVAVVPALARRLPPEAARAAALRAYGPALRLGLVAVYAWSGFHKLNTSYLDAGVSCGAAMYRAVAEALPVFPSGHAAETAAIWSTLAGECAVAALLCSRRTAVAGVVCALVLHTLFGLHTHRGVYSFSATAAALLWLFVPAARAAQFRAPRGWSRAAVIAAGAVALAYGAAQVARATGDDDARVMGASLRAGHVAWGVEYALCAFLLARGLRASRGAAPADADPPLRVRGWAAIVPALVVVNGACPYLGLKTETSFSMFSNLATEQGRTNHLLVPATVQVTPWLRDVVEIVDSNSRALRRARDDGCGVTYLRLRTLRTTRTGPFRVSFLRDGRMAEFDTDRPETHAALPPAPWIVTKLCPFRPVDLGLRTGCRH